MPKVAYSVGLSWTGASGSPGNNVWHMFVPTGDPEGGLADLSGIIEDFYTGIAGIYPGQVTISSPEFVTGVGSDVGFELPAPDWSIVGTGTSNFLPPANCMLVDWKTGQAGRRGRGRTFLGPLSRDAVEADGSPGPTYITTVANAASDLVTANTALGDGFVGVYSRVDDLVRTFSSSSVPNLFAVLRSRRD